MKKRFFALVLALCFFLTACSDDVTPAQPSNPTSGTSQASAGPTATLAPDTTPELGQDGSLTAAATVPFRSAAPDAGGTPSPTPVYGSLPTPPRALTTTPVTPAESAAPLPGGWFVVASHNGLFLLSADGKDDRTLVSGAYFSDPVVSPDGTRIAVFRHDPISLQKRLYIVSSGGAMKLVTETGGTILNATWSPDSKTLALTRVTDTNGDGVADDYDAPVIWLYDVAGEKQKQLTEGRNPAFSPDGTRLAFTIPGPFSSDYDPTTHKLHRNPNSLAVYNLQQNAKRVLLDTKKLEVSLPSSLSDKQLAGQTATVRYFKETAWSPDGKLITASADAITKSGVATGLILAFTLEDTSPKTLAAGGDAANRVGWSKDGKNLAFEVEPRYPVKPDSAFRVAVVDNAGSGTAQTPRAYFGNAANRSEARSPLWLSDGRQLAFLEGDNGVLVVIGADGNGEKKLVSGCTGFDTVRGQ